MLQIGNKRILQAYIGNTRLTDIRLGDVSLVSSIRVFSLDFPDIIGNIELGRDNDASTDILSAAILDLENSYAYGVVNGINTNAAIEKIGTNLYAVPSFCNYLTLEAKPLAWSGEEGEVGAGIYPYYNCWYASPSLSHTRNLSSAQGGKVQVQIGVPRYTFYQIDYQYNDWVTFGYDQLSADYNGYMWNSPTVSGYAQCEGIMYCMCSTTNLRPIIDASSCTFADYSVTVRAGETDSFTTYYESYHVDSITTGGGVHSVRIPLGWKLKGGFDEAKQYETSLFNAYGSTVSEVKFNDSPSTQFKVTKRPS